MLEVAAAKQKQAIFEQGRQEGREEGLEQGPE